MTRLYHWQLAPVVTAIKRTGIHKWLMSGPVNRSAFPPMRKIDRQRLLERIEPDLVALEAELPFDLRLVWDLGEPMILDES